VAKESPFRKYGKIKPMFGFYRETWSRYATGKRDENIPIPIPRRHKCRTKRMTAEEDEVRKIAEEDAKRIKKKLEKEYDAGMILDELGMGHLKTKKK
jgi:hypothetical protein